MKFKKCNTCGNLVQVIEESGVSMICCGSEMEIVEEKTADSSTEKHVPLIEREGDLVKLFVGSTEHPMTDEHHISFLAIKTTKGCQIKKLSHTEKPCASFILRNEELVAAYEYCNLHGLWVNKI